ncbi:MAG TPA: DHHA1 domain-containing protein [Vicinamibacterales bacterium]|nr:DHHA1 domain-containing protein [Vicinamibacterales bacterium]
MTQRLYYNEPYRRSFDAAIATVEPGESPAELVVTLDRTAFYPTSGGQPFDTGMLSGRRVTNVFDRDDDAIAHVIQATETGSAGLAPGTAVHGDIDWQRRFDHMQQHTGQHVLSAAFDRLFKVATVSFHLGAETSTIDLARGVSASEIAAAEDEANRIVWEDRPVHIKYADAEEAAALKLRKPSAREGTLRLIDVEGFDLSACGGTHVSRTGGIGVIAVASAEKFKGGQRLEFLCGGRALARFRTLRDTAAAGVRLLSVLPSELPAAIERIQGEARDYKRSLTALQNELAGYRAGELAASAEPAGAVRLVARALDADAGALKALAAAVAGRSGHVAVLISAARPSLAVVARASDVPLNAQQVLSAMVQRFGGRGGGKPELAQGGGLDAAPEAILAFAREAIAGTSQA